jgi:hypothetical protein|tara:strand:+ start:813 stop:1031 length:219 start_codon:yes stop_codon:yes gene_type:complete
MKTKKGYIKNKKLLKERLDDLNTYDEEEWIDMRKHMYRNARSLWNKDMDIFKYNVKTNCATQLGFDKRVILH